MKKREMICIACPIGCHLEVIEDKTSEGGYIVKGATCKRGEVYGVKEMSNPTRLLTSTVKISGGSLKRLPVRTSSDIPKNRIFDCMKLINAVEVEAPIEMGDVIIEDILGTGVDIIASRSLH